MQSLTTCTSLFTLLHPQPLLSKQTAVFIRLLPEKGNRIIGLCIGCIEPFFSFCSIITTVCINWSFNKSPSNSHSRWSLGLRHSLRSSQLSQAILQLFYFSLLLCFTLLPTGAQRGIIVCFLSHLPCWWRDCTPFWSFQHFCGQSLPRPLWWE